MGEWKQTVYGAISNSFVVEPLKNLCAPKGGIQTGPFGSQLHKRDYVEKGTPIITVEHLGENRIIHESTPLVSDADKARLSKYTLQIGDIVFSRVGSVDRRALVREAEDGWLFSGRCLRVRPNVKIADPAYLSFFFGLPAFKEHIRSIAVGATMPSLNTSLLSDVLVPLPPLPEQRAIAAVLCALDDKIALNRRMNETLEGLARALFKDWFVDFGPTRAKASGAKPYLPPETLSLFPDRLDDNGLPEGWEMGALADIAQSPRRGVKPADVGEDTPYIGLEHMPRRSIALTDWDGAEKVSSNKSRFRKGEFLFGKLRPYFHKVGVASVDGICSTDIVVVTPKAEEWAALTLACISSDDFVEYTNAGSTGTKMPRTSWKIMAAYELCIPPREVAQAYQEIVWPMIEKIIDNIHQSRTLAQTHDLLLPKLMSGEIRVREAEKIVEGGRNE